MWTDTRFPRMWAQHQGLCRETPSDVLGGGGGRVAGEAGARAEDGPHHQEAVSSGVTADAQQGAH